MFVKPIENPIILPEENNNWEVWQTFNPAAILLKNKVHFVYRAIGEDYISRLGYAVSEDGFKIDERLPYPIYEHRPTTHCSPIHTTHSSPNPTFYSFASGGSFGGCEDPRIVRVDKEDVLYMTYTACDRGLRVGLTSIKIKDFLRKIWKWKSPKLISPPGEINKNYVIFPEKINGKYAILHSINPKVLITYVDSLEFEEGYYIYSHFGGGKAQNNCWDSEIRGAGPPPIKTKDGWLLFYHAIDKREPSKYKVGAMLLDLNDPTRILHRSKEPILEPNEQYENNGFKPGIVYASGAVVKDDNLLIYYGGADSYVCVAYADFNEFLEALGKEVKPKVERKVLKKRKLDDS